MMCTKQCHSNAHIDDCVVRMMCTKQCHSNAHIDDICVRMMCTKQCHSNAHIAHICVVRMMCTKQCHSNAHIDDICVRMMCTKQCHSNVHIDDICVRMMCTKQCHSNAHIDDICVVRMMCTKQCHSNAHIAHICVVRYLGFDHTATLFHIRDSPTDPVERAVYLTNTFNFAIRIHNVSLPEEAKSMFSVLNFSAPILVPPHESRYIFSLHFTPARPSIHIDSNILLITNASKFHLPPFVLPPSLEERFLDFSVLSVTESSSILFAVINSNPIELAVKSWRVIGDSLTIELLKSDKGNKTTILDRIQQLQNSTLSDQTTVILASGYYAVFRVTLTAKELEGTYDGAIQITTDYEGKVVHQSFNIQSSFSQKVKLQHIRSVTEDVRFYYKRLKSNKDDLEPRRKSKVANIYFDARLQCGDHCYAGLPFLSKGESKPHGLVMQQDLWDADMDLHQTFHKRWRELKENSGHEAHAVFEVDTDLQKNVDARVTAQMIWPSIINTPRQIMFPLTNTNSSSVSASFSLLFSGIQSSVAPVML
ncbi:UNVERIFIED_CONTAM: hypothetical protein FKN15_076169 [Acipenser sinensis]